MTTATAAAPPLVMYPYQRGAYPRAILGALWQLMEAEGATAKVFHAQQGPETERGDLVEFVRYFDDPKRVLLIMAEPDTKDLVGMVWFDDVVAGHRAAINIFYARKVWGARSRAATREAITWAFQTLGVASMWGYTPHRTAVRHGQALGFQIVAVLPEFARVGGRPQDVTILRLLRSEWDTVTR
ncbi:MAG TPA: GNAT family protein [Terriglobales bacterium]|nr:GNAT family protein [Terriglobales bacterium]